MSVTRLEIKSQTPPMEVALMNAEKSLHLENLFRKWRDIELALDAHAAEDTDSLHNQSECNRLIEARRTLAA